MRARLSSPQHAPPTGRRAARHACHSAPRSPPTRALTLENTSLSQKGPSRPPLRSPRCSQDSTWCGQGALRRRAACTINSTRRAQPRSVREHVVAQQAPAPGPSRAVASPLFLPGWPHPFTPSLIPPGGGGGGPAPPPPPPTICKHPRPPPPPPPPPLAPHHHPLHHPP